MAERVAGAVAGTPNGDAGKPLPGDLAAWAKANLVTMRGTLAPLIEKAERQTGTGPLAGPLRAAGGVLLAGEIGGIVGFMGRHVLGQYELALLDPTQGARLLLVVPNLHEAARGMEVELDELLPWVVFHEVTHAVQFNGVPWLREHLAGMLRELLSSVQVKIDPAALLKLPTADDLKALWEHVRDGGLVTAALGAERKALLEPPE